MSPTQEPIIVEKNRQRGFWALVIVVCFIPISAILVILGLQPGRPDVSWSLILFGILGLLAFGGSALAIIQTMRSPWHVALTPAQLTLYTPTYDLFVPWDKIVGIAVHEVNRREGCALVFDDLPGLVAQARFHHRSRQADAVNDPETMQARMEANFEAAGYHLAIPGRILEAGPDELAQLLARGRTGQLWQEESEA